MKKIFLSFLVVILLGLLGLIITDNAYILKAVRVTYLRGNTDATIYDYQVQATKTIKATNPQPLPLDDSYNQIPLSNEIVALHNDLKTHAFLIIHDGKILTEKYFLKGSKEHLSGVWSITKTYTSLLILKAVEDGFIASVDDTVSMYIPELQPEQETTLTLRHLASMSAGLYWDEQSHTPFSLITKVNFHNNINKVVLNEIPAIAEPGKTQHYNSGGTQLLGIVLKRVLAKQNLTISEYLEKKIWTTLGYEYDGLFIVDSKQNNNEKVFGGLVMTARDVSKLGQLFLQNGQWNGQQIISGEHMKLFTTLPYNNTTYHYGIWSGNYNGHPFYYQSGFGGQMCITVPDFNLVITRLGQEITPKENLEDVVPDTYTYIEEALRIVEESKILEGE